ncbi:MAG: hypothetical protein GF383_06910 [Candidatus Lokiarchaeota archaeon]|nr:hypothetical protein [Candidatus Lokiarchaeota archaeon]MBD3339879.1 hypothetical protein [Candidatus Lokiarchaeota archaeon]
MSRSNIEKIVNLIKDLPETTRPEEIDEIMYRLYAKKEILEGLDDSRKNKVISLEEFKNRMAEKWLKENGT